MTGYLNPAGRYERFLFGIILVGAAIGFAVLPGYVAVAPTVSSPMLLLVVALTGLSVTGPAAYRVLFSRARPDGELIPLAVVILIGILLLSTPIWLVLEGVSDWKRHVVSAVFGVVALVHAWRRWRYRIRGA
jgi:heme O synthase-like polyprenyltransferase